MVITSKLTLSNLFPRSPIRCSIGAHCGDRLTRICQYIKTAVSPAYDFKKGDITWR